MGTVSRDQNKMFVGEWTQRVNHLPTGDTVSLLLDGKEVAEFRRDVDPRMISQFLAFAQTAPNLAVAGLNSPPRVFITIDQEELNRRGGHGETIATVEMVRQDDDAVARFHLSVFAPDSGGVSADLRAVRRNTDVVRNVKGSFVDWNRS